MPKNSPGMAAGMMSRKSSTRRPVQVPRWTSQPATSAKAAEKAAAATPYTRVFWSAVPFGPEVMYSKCCMVNPRTVGKFSVKALTTSEP